MSVPACASLHTLHPPACRSEVGEVANPRAWYNPEKLIPEVIELHKVPLRVEGWCEALIETTRLRSSHQSSNLSSCMAKAKSVPSLVLTGGDREALLIR